MNPCQECGVAGEPLDAAGWCASCNEIEFRESAVTRVCPVDGHEYTIGGGPANHVPWCEHTEHTPVDTGTVHGTFPNGWKHPLDGIDATLPRRHTFDRSPSLTPETHSRQDTQAMRQDRTHYVEVQDHDSSFGPLVGGVVNDDGHHPGKGYALGRMNVGYMFGPFTPAGAARVVKRATAVTAGTGEQHYTYPASGIEYVAGELPDGYGGRVFYARSARVHVGKPGNWRGAVTARNMPR